MFWGLVLKANRKYSQSIKKPFHLSQAALDATSCNDEPVQVFLTSENNKYLICTLRKGKTEQVSLDLNFSEGDVISFQSQGNGSVHLSGYLIELEPDFGGEDDFNAELEAQLKSKIKAENGKLAKKDDEEGDDDESDDSDLAGVELEEDDDEEEGDEDEENDDDDDDDDEEEDDEEDEEESEEEIQEPKPKQVKLDKRKQQQQNGLEKKTPKEGAKKDVIKQETPKGGEKTIQGGVKIEDIQVGNGPVAKPGKKVQVYYEGRLKSNNRIFDSSKQGAGFKFSLGRGEVIKAWDVGVAGMKVGGKRRIVCPPHMAYGARGSLPVIPPNSTLVFDVELKGVN